VTGLFYGTVDFRADWGGGTDAKTAGGLDAFVTKIHADGSYGWTRRLGGPGEDRGLAGSADTSGNVFLTGAFSDTVDFREDWGTGVDLKTSNGWRDIFVTRINADGSYGWTRCMGGAESDWGYGIAADGSGSVYVTGAFKVSVDFRADWGDGSDWKSTPWANTWADVFVTKIFSDGAYGWTKRIGGGMNDEARAIVLDGSGNIFLTGYYDGTASEPVNFSADWGSEPDVKGGYANDLFITKLLHDGSYGWTRRVGGLYADWGYALAVDASGTGYITGYFRDTVDFQEDWSASPEIKTSAGSGDVFITKFK
jgi:hypothetical protein